MNICRYTDDRKQNWDDFVRESKNGTFLFLRDYMDYHRDRFTDHSLMYYETSSQASRKGKGELVAIMPANEAGEVQYSHQGLTYGGLVLSKKIHTCEVGEIFQLTIDYLREHGFSKLVYRQIPSVYHLQPSEEDTYWLWRNKAEMVGCNMMTAIDLHDNNTPVSSRKITYYNKLQREGYSVKTDAPLGDFWSILESNLQERFGARPVHTLQEIASLQKTFRKNIICCTVHNPQGTVVAGTLLFITQQVVRTQYISASHEGKQCNALDFLMLNLIRHYRKHPEFRFLEFGTSMAEDGVMLNDGLILQKEGFGGRSIACRTFELTL